ncbi:hypothetical protein KUG88_02550 [Rhodococcus rhodochrous]|uniref:hypothetical protein n=1 Tax=Rhodococcus rhodochrous TaxID=1829 RepID=UPI001E575A8D|nr:hypothetical protein [Rhodococcus rhodochrous]MCB8909016.1 hypothetical protein [Rhodococcus rhodochrous]
MISHDELTHIVASGLMPDAPELVLATAGMVARAILDQHAVVKLPEPSHVDEQGTSWHAESGRVLATASNADVWCGDDLLDADDAIEESSAMLAAARMARLHDARLGVRW